MGQQKPKKSKPKKNQAGPKKLGTQADVVQFRSQLDILGLRIVRVTADGNCFFRCLADQLEGNEEEHKKYRHMVVEYITNNRADYEPFIEDGVPFDEYCENMGKAGTWAGHMELQAASLVTRRNICIHRLMSPRWYIRNFGDHEANMIHLSYHDGEHYNSVRLKEDLSEGPAKPIMIKADANISADDHGKKATVYDFKGSSHDFVDGGAIKLVMAGTGCESSDRIKQVLQEVRGDLDAAIEFLIVEQQMIKDIGDIYDISCEHDGGRQNGSCEQPVIVSGDMRSSNNFQSVKGHRGQQKTSKNRGCAPAARKSLPVPASKNKSVASSKNKKGTKGNQKKGATKEVPERRPDPLPDLGALCI